MAKKDRKSNDGMPELTQEQLDRISAMSKKFEEEQEEFCEMIRKTLRFDPKILHIPFTI